MTNGDICIGAGRSLPSDLVIGHGPVVDFLPVLPKILVLPVDIYVAAAIWIVTNDSSSLPFS